MLVLACLYAVRTDLGVHQLTPAHSSLRPLGFSLKCCARSRANASQICSGCLNRHLMLFAQSRMSQFAGKKSLSSAEYFGRDERPAWQTQRDGKHSPAVLLLSIVSFCASCPHCHFVSPLFFAMRVRRDIVRASSSD